MARTVICPPGTRGCRLGWVRSSALLATGSPLIGSSSKLLQGHTFKMQWLLDEARQAEAADQSSFCNPTALHNAVVLRLAILNEAIAATNQTLVDSAYDPLYDATRRALSCAPADPFVWLTLFWLDVGKRGFE